MNIFLRFALAGSYSLTMCPRSLLTAESTMYKDFRIFNLKGKEGSADSAMCKGFRIFTLNVKIRVRLYNTGVADNWAL